MNLDITTIGLLIFIAVLLVYIVLLKHDYKAMLNHFRTTLIEERKNLNVLFKERNELASQVRELKNEQHKPVKKPRKRNAKGQYCK